MNFDLIQIERTGYTVTDLLADVGGLQGILISGIAIIMNILNGNYLEEFLAQKLFKSQKVPLQTTSKCQNIKNFIVGLLPCLIYCLGKKKKQRVLE